MELANPGSRLRCRAGITVALLVVLMALGHLLLAGGRSCAGPGESNKYVGVEQCMACHSSKATGDQYGKWLKHGHSKAYHTLASDHAKEEAKEWKVEDPQKSKRCLTCHVTGYGLPDRMKGKELNATRGVQCESCHGPGAKHVKARRQAAQGKERKEQAGAEAPEWIDIPDNEIVKSPPPQECRTCHPKSVSPPCFQGEFQEIAHLDPRKKRRKNYLNTLCCECPGCECRGDAKDRTGAKPTKEVAANCRCGITGTPCKGCRKGDEKPNIENEEAAKAKGGCKPGMQNRLRERSDGPQYSE